MRFLPLLALVLLAAAPLRAQSEGPFPRQVVPGARVRVLEAGAGGRRFAGTVVRADSARLEVASGPSGRSLPWDRVELIEVSRGRRTFGSALKGMAIGAVLGFAVYKSYADARYDNDEFNGVAALVEGAPVGALAGLGIGLALGRERWRPVGGTAIRPYVAPGGGASVAVVLR
ncbi:MAG TPA: hypothetical protein VF615_03775 [Longimicrobiaceae bacterium]|jgi:hypothetical protein